MLTAASERESTMRGFQPVDRDSRSSLRSSGRRANYVLERAYVAGAPVGGVLDTRSQLRIHMPNRVGKNRAPGPSRGASAVAAFREGHARVAGACRVSHVRRIANARQRSAWTASPTSAATDRVTRTSCSVVRKFVKHGRSQMCPSMTAGEMYTRPSSCMARHSRSL